MATKRTFPPLYVSSGDKATDQLAFFHILEKLKTQKRTGWVDHGIPQAESISDHMYRMAVLAMCTSDEKLDVARCVMLAVVHDLAEAQVGDITPREGISKPEKRQLEEEAMNNFVHEMLHDSPPAKRILNLWKEYEMQETPEARFVKDLDRFEMASQAFEYERVNSDKDLQTFFDSSVPHIRHEEVAQWGDSLLKERARSMGDNL
ncbi:HD domain-containing protein [Cylindrobasidium torrendii FP15055 ss-10]|uniref:5'-deoxynucleotidase n=1 Tax=Cylindrobasidium torrendii FP15055 ss-10 TaxID=1314674 RepID=A0A0D7BI08_9AGAR|nr:HD domain-containing protein [Cylindrobasidium torrendii FP15055 ss-10]